MTDPAPNGPIDLEEIASKTATPGTSSPGSPSPCPPSPKYGATSAPRSPITPAGRRSPAAAGELAAVRLDRANALAAMRAALAADRDAEPDPLYLPPRRTGDRPRRARGAAVSSYRQMRRHARQARRAGMQPMMVINAGNQLPDPAASWPRPLRLALPVRTRPVAAMAALAGVGWRPTRRSPLVAVSSPAQPPRLALAAFGARLGSHLAERLYAAPAPRRGGGWLAAATAAGPFTAAAAATAGHRRPGAGRAVVGAPAPAGEGPGGAQARRVAGHRAGRRAARLGGHVRDRGPVGVAGPAAAGTRPDHRRRDRQNPRDRIGAGHLPGRAARLPHPRRPGQPVRAAGAGQRPARRRDRLARHPPHVHHPAG